MTKEREDQLHAAVAELCSFFNLAPGTEIAVSEDPDIKDLYLVWIDGQCAATLLIPSPPETKH